MTNWGGQWTKKKIEALVKYVESYLTIMNKRNWKTIYFDGFAGTGSLEVKKDESGQSILDILELKEEYQGVYDGASKQVYSMPDPFGFDYYYFIEMDPDRRTQLELSLKSVGNGRIAETRAEDCNDQLSLLAETMKRRPDEFAALIFLDPFGMQLKWEIIAGLKNTRSDVWILVPSGIAINRLLQRDGVIKGQSKLEDFFGTSIDEIRSYFYKMNNSQDSQMNLFGDTPEAEEEKIKNPINEVANFYCDRLKTVWKEVSDPMPLRNSNGAIIFHFIFASNVKVGTRIANHIIGTS